MLGKARSTIFLLPLLFCSSCGVIDDLFEKEGNIADYVGNYVLSSATEKTYHVYWNQKTFTGEKNIMETGAALTIKEDKTIFYVEKSGKAYKGTIKVLESYCRFSGIPISNSYEFKRRYDGVLYWSKESPHMAAEYDVTYSNITFSKA